MASLQQQADAIRTAVASCSTCTPATVVSLKSLLLPPTESDLKPISSSARTTSRAAQSRPNTASGPSRPGTAAAKRRPAARPADETRAEQLAPKEKAQLATHVVNATLKALTEASKPRTPPTPAPKPAAAGDDDAAPPKTAITGRLRRSMSAPLIPLQPRAFNRVVTSPTKSSLTAAQPNASANSHGPYLATVECARVAFLTLRTVQDAGQVTLPDLQLEAGMSSFVAKLIGLGMLDQACRELRVLKGRLTGRLEERSSRTTSRSAVTTSNATKTTRPRETKETSAVAATSESPSDLLDYGDVAGTTTPALRLVVASQLQALRILVALKKPSHVDASLIFLRRSSRSSALHTVLRCVKAEATLPAEQQKALRQLETLSQLLLALTPSIASKDDSSALEPKLSIAPSAALELQVLSLEARLCHWRLSAQAKHDADKDIVSPFARCLSTYARRCRSAGKLSYSFCRRCFDHAEELLATDKHTISRTSKSPLASIYQTLSATARETGHLDDAIHWASEYRGLLTASEDSAARRCSAAALLLSLQLKKPEAHLQSSHALLTDVLESVKGSLKGDTVELEELLVNVCLVRKAAMNLLISQGKKDTGDSSTNIVPESTQRLMETFIHQCPRFCLRWLGKPPAAKSCTKDFLRYEQRRQLLSQSIRPTLDSAFVVTKTMIEESRMVWDQLDAVLGDSLTVLEYLGDLKSTADAASSYYVKISHFYYLNYNALRKAKESELDALKALRRAVDCVKHRSAAEKERAHLIPKLERLGDMCKSTGQIGEGLGAFQSIRSSLVDDGVLAQTVTLLKTQPPSLAWTANSQVETLSRALITISRLEQVQMDWTGGLEEEERAAVLEHELHFICLGGSSSKSSSQRITLTQPCVESLLRIYYPTRFPIRRLRTLLRLVSVNIDTPEVLADIQPQLTAVLGLVSGQGLGDDETLAGYLPHYQALANSLSGFGEGYSDVPGLESCLATWRSLLASRPTRADLEQVIDSISDLQMHLQSVAEFMRAMGRDAILTQVLELSSRLCSISSDGYRRLQISNDTLLASHYVRIGESLKAEQILGSVSSHIEQGSQAPELVETVANFHLSFAEYLIAVGRLDEAHHHLVEVKPSAADATTKSDGPHRRTRILGARASMLQSILALERGDADLALQSARSGVRMLFHDWSRLEKAMLLKNEDGSVNMSVASEDVSTVSVTGSRTAASPEFWTLFHPLFDGMMRLSSIYAHLGMFQETVYYAEQAQKIATATNGALCLAQSEAWLSSVWLRASKPDRSSELAAVARSRMAKIDQTGRKAALACELGGLFREIKDEEGETEMIRLAEAIIEHMSDGSGTAAMPEADVVVGKTTRATTARRAKTAVATKPATATSRRKAAAKSTKKAVDAPAPVPAVGAVAENAAVVGLRDAVLLNQAMSLLNNKDWSAALAILQASSAGSDVCTLPKTRAETLVEQVTLAACLLGYSTEQMARDAVFSVIPDSTLSFPAVSSGSSSTTTASKMPSGAQGFVDSLLEAQSRLIEAQAMAAMSGDASTLHRISSMLQSAVITLSAMSWSTPRAVSEPAYATCSVELARNMTWRRERKALLVEKASTWRPDAIEESTADSRRCSLGLSTADIGRFQRDYIDIIPKEWSVVSLALAENNQDLCITKLQAGSSPFVLRLPLERAVSRDADTEVFSFQQGRSELLEIIAATNASCHDARDMTVKGAKSAWWTERTALDEQLRELLDNVEQVWLGGFRGIFSQHTRRAEPFGRFQQTFEGILDKHLPSRRTVRGKRGGKAAASRSSHRVSLDGRTLDLFIGLGDATAEGCDFDDALNDLLYFVVDILQFHGERNAYDEIDFDSMVIETLDGLCAYHSAVRELDGRDDGRTATEAHAHTILVLDKALHVFPWEALPCLQGSAVSRIPSLACLRQLLDGRTEKSAASGHYASASAGAYMLNPSGDLASTQGTFDEPLSASVRGSWTRIVGRAPTEDEFEAVLRDKDVLLYFGHGSGAQYIRGRTVRKLDRCRATALLMGCSSAGLDYNGDFELHGPVWNYMLAGCPAVVGTLWDVTDRDIDRFAGRVFEEWGLLPPGSFDKAATKPAAASRSPEAVSLVEAIVRAREAPRFRYLTAAAVCVYGIPVYLRE
ncbi:separin [Grosmannia clavigera kw1407]|uniref:separase n=1 Tax=Grosmannia clavigera (strain kw1407 / UAMH 11150) TaxID=655863 RepID=F0XAD9_GROCL|nr:separin [Grosmannia clavigera kw1407]EFX05341.1 separin [Grosmannia clavigera kw1407]